MDKHAHAHEEVYFVFEGEGFAVVGDERKPVGPGDVINIPSNVPHTMENAKDAPFLWAAFWWNRDQDAPALRRTKAKAEAAAKELHDIVEGFAASGWDLIAAPAKAWLEGEENQDALVKAIEQADAQCGSCGASWTPSTNAPWSSRRCYSNKITKGVDRFHANAGHALGGAARVSRDQPKAGRL